jgi:hypothetical protein
MRYTKYNSDDRQLKLDLTWERPVQLPSRPRELSPALLAEQLLDSEVEQVVAGPRKIWNVRPHDYSFTFLLFAQDIERSKRISKRFGAHVERVRLIPSKGPGRETQIRPNQRSIAS